MADESQTTSFLLSREELILLLDLLEVVTVPGLDPDPLGELSDEQRALALIWAGRALRARGLAAIGDDGSLLVDKKLLTAVSTCAFWEATLNVYHWSAPGRAPIRFFGCVQNGHVAAHTRPEDVLHRFSTLSSAEALVEAATAVCQCQDFLNSSSVQHQLSLDLFVQARESAEAQETNAAQEALRQGGIPEDTVQALTAVLSGASRMSIWQIVKRGENGDPQTHDYTLLQHEQTAWLISLLTGENEIHIQTVSPPFLKELLNQYLIIS
jgi:hypothetical protein